MTSHSSQLRLSSPILFTCEHASRRIPRAYKQLGMSRYDLKYSKDWYDPGSLDLMRLLADEFDASFLISTVSRLVIDANRRLQSKISDKDTFYSCALKRDVLIEDEYGERLVPIPFNRRHYSIAEERRRWNDFVKPYLERGTEMAQALYRRHGRVLLIQMHSFYPSYNGKVRTVDIDIISDTARPLFENFLSCMRTKTPLTIGDNQPWSMKDADGGIFDELQRKERHIVFGIDVNNKHLKTPSSIKKIARIIAGALRKSGILDAILDA